MFVKPERAAQLEMMWEIYLFGCSAAEVGWAFDITRQAVLDTFRVHGYAVRATGRAFNPEQRALRIQQALDSYDQTTSVVEAAKQLDQSYSYTYTLLRAAGVLRRDYRESA